MQIKNYATPLSHISLTDERGGPQSKRLSLYVHKPAIGTFVESFIPLEGCFHLEDWTNKWTKEVVTPSTFSTTSRKEEVVVLNSSLYNGDPSLVKRALLLTIGNGSRTSLEGIKKRSHVPAYSKLFTRQDSPTIIVKISYEFSSNIGVLQ